MIVKQSVVWRYEETPSEGDRMLLLSPVQLTDVCVMLMPDELMFLSVCSLQIRTTIRRCLASWTTASWLPMPLACSSGEYACVSAHVAPFAFDRVVMFFCFCVCSGIFGERLPLRYYLSFGMLTSGLFTCLFGLGFYWKIHSLAYYAFIQVLMQQHVNTTHTLDNSSISE